MVSRSSMTYFHSLYNSVYIYIKGGYLIMISVVILESYTKNNITSSNTMDPGAETGPNSRLIRVG